MSPYDLHRSLVAYRWHTRQLMQKYRAWPKRREDLYQPVPREISESELRSMWGDR